MDKSLDDPAFGIRRDFCILLHRSLQLMEQFFVLSRGDNGLAGSLLLQGHDLQLNLGFRLVQPFLLLIEGIDGNPGGEFCDPMRERRDLGFCRRFLDLLFLDGAILTVAFLKPLDDLEQPSVAFSLDDADDFSPDAIFELSSGHAKGHAARALDLQRVLPFLLNPMLIVRHLVATVSVRSLSDQTASAGRTGFEGYKCHRFTGTSWTDATVLERVS